MSRELMSVAEIKWQQNDYLGAVRDYEKLIESYPKSSVASEAYYWKGIAFSLYFDDPELAVTALKKVIHLEKTRGVSVYNLEAGERLAEIYDKKLDRPRDAISAYEDVVAMSEDKDQVLESRFKIGELYYKMGDMAQARVEWGLLVENDPKSRWAPAALYRKAGTHFVSGEYEKALEIYRSLYTVYPEDENSHFAKFRAANCLELIEEPLKAIALYKELEGSYPDQVLIKQKLEALDQLVHPPS